MPTIFRREVAQIGSGVCGFRGVKGLDMRIYGEIRGKNLWEWEELEVDPLIA